MEHTDEGINLHDGEIEDCGPRDVVVEEGPPHIIIVEAFYGPAHVERIIVNRYRNGQREFRADNRLFGDPAPGE